MPTNTLAGVFSFTENLRYQRSLVLLAMSRHWDVQKMGMISHQFTFKSWSGTWICSHFIFNHLTFNLLSWISRLLHKYNVDVLDYTCFACVNRLMSKSVNQLRSQVYSIPTNSTHPLSGMKLRCTWKKKTLFVSTGRTHQGTVPICSSFEKSRRTNISIPKFFWQANDISLRNVFREVSQEMHLCFVLGKSMKMLLDDSKNSIFWVIAFGINWTSMLSASSQQQNLLRLL